MSMTEETKGAGILKNFIVLEGLDGAGTTTQLNLLRRKCEAVGVSAFFTFEPSGGPVGLLIRRILKKEVTVHPATLARLYASDRFDHLYQGEESITARLNRGQTVFCDRYLFSSLAYQSIDCGFEEVLSMNRYPLPEHLFYLEVPVPECRHRMADRGLEELFDAESVQTAVSENYLKSFNHFEGSGMSFHRIDGTEPAEKILENIWSLLPGLPIT